jgi:hypothetical protein
MAPTLRAHGIPIPNRLGKCLARAVAGSLDIVPWHALYVSAMQEFLSTIDRQGTVTLLHNRTDHDCALIKTGVARRTLTVTQG